MRKVNCVGTLRSVARNGMARSFGFTLKINVLQSFETPVNIYLLTYHNITEGLNLSRHSYEHLEGRHRLITSTAKRLLYHLLWL